MDPMWRLFDYACDKFYYVECKNEWCNYIKGLLLDYNGTYCTFLTDLGLYIIKSEEINAMAPMCMPQNLPDNFKELIKIYIKERAEQNEKNNNNA